MSVPQLDVRLLTLDRLLEIDVVDLTTTLTEATTILAEIFTADKIDVFLYEAEAQTLVARSISNTPMGQRQRALGLDRLPLANKGRTVEVFETCQPFASGHLADDPQELVGVKEDLGVRSTMLAPLVVERECRGVFSAIAAHAEAFSDEDFHFFQIVSRWVAPVTHRAELAERVGQQPAQRDRVEVAAEVAQLTPREQEVVSLIAEGLTNVEIAGRMTITAGTVANHAEHIREKLGLRSRTHIAVWAVEHGLYRTDQGPAAGSGG